MSVAAPSNDIPQSTGHSNPHAGAGPVGPLPPPELHLMTTYPIQGAGLGLGRDFLDEAIVEP